MFPRLFNVGRRAAISSIMLVAVACSSNSGSDAPSSDALDSVDAAAAERSFCEQAQAIQTFQNEVAVDLADPAKAPAFIEVALVQLRILGDKASSDITSDIDAVIAGYEALDAELAANDYQLNALLVSGYSDATANEATDRLDDYLANECGLRAGRPDIDAPRPFTAAELTELLAVPEGAQDESVAEIDDDTVVQQLVDALGLAPEQASCLVDGLGEDPLAVLLGEPLAGEELAEFEALLADCSINPEDFG